MRFLENIRKVSDFEKNIHFRLIHVKSRFKTISKVLFLSYHKPLGFDGINKIFSYRILFWTNYDICCVLKWMALMISRHLWPFLAWDFSSREDPNQGIIKREFTVYYEPFCQTLYINIILTVRIFVWSHNITFRLYTWTDRTLFCRQGFRLDEQRTQTV